MNRFFLILFAAVILTFAIAACGDNDHSPPVDTPDDEPLGFIPYATTPSWESSDASSVSTGLGIADINGDGLPDIVVANGNDIKKQPLAVYFNQGGGVYNTDPDWMSLDNDYLGHLSLADIDKNGYTDVAVSVYIGQNGFSSPGHVKVYFTYDGVLESTPSWRSAEDFYSFSLRFGDLDGDGYPDLAVATGESYTLKAETNKVFMNRGGQLETTPSWQSVEADYSYDVAWGDMDRDGDLDLIFVRSGDSPIMFLNRAGVLDTSPFWQARDESVDTNSLVLGDINNDGFLDLAVSDNYQLGGEGRFKIYYNISGLLNVFPDWLSTEQGYGSGIFFADVDRDGYRELITGTWGENSQIGSGHIRIYDNIGGLLETSSSFVSESQSVVEAITAADLAQRGLLTAEEAFTASAEQTVFQLEKAPIEMIQEVAVNNQPLPTTAWYADLETGWVSISRDRLTTGNTVTVTATYSKRPDIIVTNWDRTRGNYIFRNTAD